MQTHRKHTHTPVQWCTVASSWEQLRSGDLLKEASAEILWEGLPVLGIQTGHRFCTQPASLTKWPQLLRQTQRSCDVCSAAQEKFTLNDLSDANRTEAASKLVSTYLKESYFRSRKFATALQQIRKTCVIVKLSAVLQEVWRTCTPESCSAGGL